MLARCALLFCFALGLAVALPATAQTPDTQAPDARALSADSVEALRAHYRLPVASPGIRTHLVALSAPGSAISTVTAFGADWRDVFGGVAYQQRLRFADAQDGAASVGVGFGDALRYAGLEVVFTVYDLVGDTFEDGSLSLKLHRRLTLRTALAVGVENVWDYGNNDSGRSLYAVATHGLALRARPTAPLGSAVVSVGAGTGRFRSEAAIVDDRSRPNVFGSVGLRVAHPAALLADWTGQDLNLGLSIAPFERYPLVITPAVADVTGRAGDGARFILGVGYGVSLF